MRLRYWTALIVMVGVGISLTLREGKQAQVPVIDLAAAMPVRPVPHEPVIDLSGPDAPVVENKQAVHTPVAATTHWSRAVAPGETLDVLLAEAGLDAVMRAEISGVIGSEYDLRRLKPGHRLAIEFAADGTPQTAALEIEDGVSIQAVLGVEPSVRVVPPTLDTVNKAAETTIGQSIYAALEAADIPTRFATDLELVFAGTLDLRRTLVGGEHLRVVWRENRLGDRVIGEPMIDFAELDLGDARYEVLWPGDDSRRTSIFKDGQLLLAVDQPIKGARLSSGFGRRAHPIHGSVRMHNGVDFAAPLGAAVYATQAGQVTFMGRRSGYGLMVEVTHAQDMKTIYAHLSGLNETLAVGQQIPKGQDIGLVGSTGTSTAPHLHYEVLVDGRPVPPLTDDRLSRLGGRTAQQTPAPVPIESARTRLTHLLAKKE